ncbi:MAG: polysaccharide biosynthesis protein [Limnochordia bacterium]|nr:polysaccharide biosynthesis protein [Limnochordia bacterium]
MIRWKRSWFFGLLDVLLVNFAFIGAFLLRFDSVSAQYWQYYLSVLVPYTAIRFLSNYFFGMYRRAWRYASIDEVLAIVGSVSVGSVIACMLNFLWFSALPPRSIVALDWFLNIALLGGSRFAWRLIAPHTNGQSPAQPDRECRNVLIVGAGDAGVLVARELRNHYGGRVRLVGFIDDDPTKQNQRILGYPVLGNKEQVPELVQEYAVDEIIISMPSVSRKVIREIVAITQETGKTVKILPGVFDLIDGNVTVSKIREVQIEDLLGRDPVNVDVVGMSAYIKDHVVLVTGAGGSIGSELCRQIVALKPRVLLLLDNCENNMYDIEMELKQASGVPLVPLVKDIRDRVAIDAVFSQYKPQVVFHAAAHKHVPLMEQNPEESIKNNVFGTYQVAWAAHRHQSQRFVLVSTDKAVNPTSVMGASKRLAEMIIQHLDTISSTTYVAVRFGNVLGSRGSVIPLFRKQILKGGPVTITHEKMIRYFMTIPEAVQLILQAGALATSGEIFVLDMGEPVSIMDLATALIRLSGFQPFIDIDIKVTGMRPGEKLFEELLTDEEGMNATNHQRIFVAKRSCLNTALLNETINAFEQSPRMVLPTSQATTAQFIQAFLPDFVVVTNTEDDPTEEKAYNIQDEAAATK